MTEATLTITSLGDRGVETVFGVIYPPQVAIVGFGRIVERPWAEGGEARLAPVVQITLSGDHRATDGHRGGLFLQEIAERLQRPEEL
jgi:pyruvate dehydrogenase E2 component (dihydrolipoamide acetyltransferase)